MDCLVHRLSDLLLENFCLLCVEELVDVEEELGLDIIGHLVIACEYLYVTVIDDSRVGLDHVFLNHSSTRHCMVEDVEVFIDCLRCNFLSETLLECCVCKIHSYDNGPADVIPHLLHCSVVDEVQVVTLYEDVGL